MTVLPPGFLWLAAGITLAVLEAFAPGAFMVWIGLAAIGTGLVTLTAQLPFAFEVMVFAGFAAVTISIGLMLRAKRRVATQINMPGSGLVGRSARALTFDGREGRVRVGDTDWQARLAGPLGVSPISSTRLEVVGVEGIVLLVRPIGDAS